MPNQYKQTPSKILFSVFADWDSVLACLLFMCKNDSGLTLATAQLKFRAIVSELLP